MRWRFRRYVLLVIILLATILLLQAVFAFLSLLQEAQRDTRCSGPAEYCNPALREKLGWHTTLGPQKCTRYVTIPRTPKALLRQLDNVREPWRWDPIKSRIEQNWKFWFQAAGELYSWADNAQLEMKQVLLVPGVLKATSFTDPEQIRKGAPAGDLQQWADLAAALYVLGHNVTLMDDFYHAGRGLRYGWFKWSADKGCQTVTYDRVFADIITMKTLMQDVLENQSCIFHVVDAYGTEAMYNHPEYSVAHGYESYYGGLGLDLKQFYTFFPHTIDNSFLGFAVQEHDVSVKKDIALLYGKDLVYFQGKKKYIQTVMSEFEVHSTLVNTSGLPSGVINHGIVTPQQYQDLLAQTKVLVGVGLPMESTGAIEGLARGCVFLNPKYTGNQTGVLQKEDKPTNRKMSSQIPYLEEYIGLPRVYTVDINDESAVKQVLKKLKTAKSRPLVPYEFSYIGMLDRVNIYVQKQDFCNTSHVWPDVGLMQPIVAYPGLSCTQQCKSSGYVCERRHFQAVHKAFSGQMAGLKCSGHDVSADLTAPYIDDITKRCVHQGDSMLYSCSSPAKQNARRLCPCRYFIRSIDAEKRTSW